MNDTSRKGVRELAHRYYTGELSYESYRNQRTQLLDRLTHQADENDTSTDDTRPMPDKTRVMQASRLRRHRAIWILTVILITIAVLIWAMKSG